ncbi:MAG: hypothetical protein ACR2FH_06875, partial [Caulobacteraceae bacterium]
RGPGWLVAFMPGDPFGLPREIMASLLEQFAPDIEWASKVVGADLLALGSDRAAERVEFDPDLVEVIYKLARDAREQRARRHIAEGLAAEARGDETAGRAGYTHALALSPGNEEALLDLRRLDGEVGQAPRGAKSRHRELSAGQPKMTKAERLTRKRERLARKRERSSRKEAGEGVAGEHTRKGRRAKSLTLP